MCGIVGVAGDARAVEILLNGLQRLEYRGYDSAGVAVMTPEGLALRKSVGKLAALQAEVEANPLPPATTGIGHTRWATHGAPNATNAHPHVGGWGNAKVAVVHNGIIENYQKLRTAMAAQGAKFVTETDTETIPFALAEAVAAGATLVKAVQTCTPTFRGSFAFVALQEGQTDTLVGTRRGAPLCVGLGAGANYFASDPLALAGLTNRFLFLEDDDIALLTATDVTVFDKTGAQVKREGRMLDLSGDMAGKMGFKHFMLKEIFEQPAVVARILQAYTEGESINLPLEGLDLSTVPSINIVACGTAYYAGLVGKSYLEQYARIPVNVDVASEFRYRNPPYLPGGVFIAVSQSGETADTLAALEHAKAHGQKIVVVTNVPTSSMARAADVTIDLLAGREIAVASTKAFTAMALCLGLLGIYAGGARGVLPQKEAAEILAAFRTLPNHLDAMLANPQPLEDLAKTLLHAQSMLYLGRGFLAPLSLEGALKMKEISYIHAEGYASGEMKHGPIALVDPSLPVVNLAASNDGLFEKTVSNLKEVEARRGRVILFTDKAGAAQLDPATRAGMTLVEIPTVPTPLLPMVFAVPLQLLAYYTATAKGTDVDQPRNLAKSVTVE